MRDDFAALDLFAAAGKKKTAARKKLMALARRKVKKSTQKEPLAAALIAKIKKKQKTDAVDAASLQGWPISLSWTAPKPETGSEDASHSQAYRLRHSS
jgi:hypothetical protein